MKGLKTYFAINIAMTYIRYPNVRMYWSSLLGIRMNIISNAMNVNRFGEIKRFLHFEDNAKKPDSVVPGIDKYWKLRPIISMLHDSFHLATSADEHIAIDEMIIPFKGRSGLKQYMKAKPKKWGFKVWVQANHNGYVNCFDLYQGQCKNAVRSNFGPIGDTVLKLCHDIHGTHKLFMDNLFTSLPLIRQLITHDIFVLGTLRTNRTPDVIQYLLDPNILQRGWSSMATSDNNITVIRWLDTKAVHTISTYAGAQPEDKEQRYDRKEKQKIEIK